MSMLSLQDALLVCEREACIVCILKDPPWGLQSGVELRQRRLTIVDCTVLQGRASVVRNTNTIHYKAEFTIVNFALNLNSL